MSYQETHGILSPLKKESRSLWISLLELHKVKYGSQVLLLGSYHIATLSYCFLISVELILYTGMACKEKKSPNSCHRAGNNNIINNMNMYGNVWNPHKR